MTVGKFYATFLIQDYFRRFKKKKEIKTGTGPGGTGAGVEEALNCWEEGAYEAEMMEALAACGD